MAHHDECGDTASTANGSDPETILSCDDGIVALIQPVLLKNMVERDKQRDRDSAGSKNDKVGPRDSVKTVEYFFPNGSKSSTEIVKPDFDRAITDETSRLDEDELSTIESPRHAADTDSTVSMQQEQMLQPKVSRLTNESCATSSTEKRLSNHVMLSELDQIESKIKAAIHHNRQVHSNSVELESVIRQSLSGRAAAVVSAPIPSELDMNSTKLESLGDLDVDFDAALTAVSLGSSQSSVDILNENQLLKQQVSVMKQDLLKLNGEKYQYEATIQKLKKELRSANKLTHKLQTKKLTEMESNFTASLHLLEAKLSEDLNNDLEQQLTLVKQERDTARELNLPLFNDLKRLYEIKAVLQQKIDELLKYQEEQKEVHEALEQKVNELLQAKEDLLEKANVADENAVGMSNQVLLAHEEISRLKSEIMYLTEERASQVSELADENAKNIEVSVQQLWGGNEQISKRDEWARLQSEEQDLRWKLEALEASMKLQLKEKDERILELEKKLEQDN